MQENMYKTVGLLRANWYNQRNQLTVYNYGTAFAISDQILITCTHNIYCEETDDYASELIFIPGLQNTTVTPRTRVYKSMKGRYYRTKIPFSLVNKEPIKEELAIVVLDQPLEAQTFLKVGHINSGEQENQMQIIGYPSQSYMTSHFLNNIKVRRLQSSGKIFKTQKSHQNSHILSYTMQTSIGVSGSPVMIRKSDGSYKIVGVHTHRGLNKNYNSGLYFNSQILSTMKKWVDELQKEFNLKKCQAFEEVSLTQTSEATNLGFSEENSEIIQIQDCCQNSTDCSEQEIQCQEQYQNRSEISDYDLFEQIYVQSCQVALSSNPKQGFQSGIALGSFFIGKIINEEYHNVFESFIPKQLFLICFYFSSAQLFYCIQGLWRQMIFHDKCQHLFLSRPTKMKRVQSYLIEPR